MKNLNLFIVSCFITGIVSAQALKTEGRTIKYDSAIFVTLPVKYGMERTAKLAGFIYDVEGNRLTIKWKVSYSQDGKPVTMFGRSDEYREQIADDRTLLDLAGNQVDTAIYKGPYITEIDFYKMIAQRGTGKENATINFLIIAAGTKPGRWKE